VSLRFAGLRPVAGGTAQADWINLTGAETTPDIAEITVFDDRVEVALEVYVGDLKTFEELIPDDWVKLRRHVEPLSLPDPLHSLVVDRPATSHEHLGYTPTAIAPVPARQRQDVARQSIFFVGHHGSVALR
jgi:hypothetical protein